ncbi:MAG: Holliday junction branch migration protein RuvA [Myxococcota bacterium]
MIAWLRGVLRARSDDHVVLDVQGVGYRVTVPVGVAAQTPLGEDVQLFVHTHVREDQIALFGFEDEGQRTAFDLLLAVSGVGPKLAVGILGDIGPGELATAVETGDVKRLKKAPGVGKRLAERLAVELKGKLPKAGIAASSGGAASGPVRATRVAAHDVWADVESALLNLDFRKHEVEGALSGLRQDHDETKDFDTLLRAALGALRK